MATSDIANKKVSPPKTSVKTANGSHATPTNVHTKSSEMEKVRDEPDISIHAYYAQS
jgi:hypothetical protein